MANKREARLALRPAASPLDRVLAAADRTRALQRIAALGVAYIDEIDAPNLREPFSIFNRRQDLREGVYGMRRQQAARKAA
jgi:hypothetical protein